MTFRCLALAGLLAAVAAPLLAETRQHGNIIYDLPADWSQGAIENGIQLLLYDGPEERCRFCYLHLGSGAAARGSIEDWLAAESPALVDPEDRGSIEIVQPPGIAGTSPRTFAMMAFRADSDLFVTFAIQAGGRYEIVGFQGWAYDQEEVLRSMAFLQDEASTLVDGLLYVSEGAEPLMPPAEPGSMSGLWWGWTSTLVPNIDGTVSMQVEHRRLVFWNDGRFYDGTPPRGLVPLDPVAMAASPDPDWGVYRGGPGRIELLYADGRTETLAAHGSAWSDGTYTLQEAEPLANGTPLSGTISSFFYSGFVPNSGVEGGVASSSSTTFQPDGTYEGESFGGAFGNFTEAGSITGGFATDAGSTPHGGTYKVRDGLLLMRPADGSGVRSELAFRADDDILIGEQFLDAD